MTLQSYLLFVAAAVALVFVPGPDMIYMLTRSVAQGRRAGILAMLGINLGAYVHLVAAVTGLSAILAASSVAFTVIKWAGAAYLIYLGVRALFSRTHPLALGAGGREHASGKTIFWQGFWSDALNPKVAMFYLALLPQFVRPEAGHVTLQLLILGLTCNMVALPINFVLVLLSSRVTETLRRNDALATWLNRAMGAMFIGLGLKLAAEKV